MPTKLAQDMLNVLLKVARMHDVIFNFLTIHRSYVSAVLLYGGKIWLEGFDVH